MGIDNSYLCLAYFNGTAYSALVSSDAQDSRAYLGQLMLAYQRGDRALDHHYLEKSHLNM